MIKRIILLIALFIIALTVHAQLQVFIPDTNFRNFLNANYPTFMDSTGDSLKTASAATLTGYLVCSSEGITDLTGVEYFNNIEGLICTNNQLTTLPALDSLSALKLLYCSNNPLTALPNLTGNSALESLECYYTQLTSLPDLSANTALTSLICLGNQLTTLPDLSANTALVQLNCSINQIITLPSLLANIALQKLYCQFNQLTTLPDLSAITALEILDCSNNQLSTLPDLSTHTGLTQLLCNNNQLTSLPGLSSNVALEVIDCRVNQLTALPDLSANTVLQRLLCDSNQLTVLPDLSSDTALIYLFCNNNQLTSLPGLSSNVALERIACSSNQLTALPDLSSSSYLQHLWCANNKLDFSDTRELRIADSLCFLNSFSIDYTPQNPFGVADTFDLFPGDTLILSIANQDNALFYQWLRGTNVVAGGPTDSILIIPNITSADSGVYTCRTYGDALKSPPMNWGPGLNGFVSEPFTVDLSLTDIEESINTSALNIYPNPTDGQITIEINSMLHGPAELKIINLLGEEVYHQSIPIIHNAYQQLLNISGYRKGIYFLILRTTERILNQKVVIQ